MSAPRTVLAQNASPMTLDGTRTFLVGRKHVAVIDPGPALSSHIEALLAELASAASVAILLTHRHPDHSAGAPDLVRSLPPSVRVTYGPGVLADGERVATDGGELIALATPGHTPDHTALHWPAQSAIFCGDLMMGGLDTALVAAPEGNLAEYLDSLDRLARLSPRVIYPTHGPHFTDPGPAVKRYREHRAERLRAVERALADGHRGLAGITAAVYGQQVDPELAPWLEATTLAYLEYLAEIGAIEVGGWHDE